MADSLSTSADQDPLCVWIHPSQFPEVLATQVQTALKERRIPSKFHYESPKQAWRWLQIHETFSPARTDASCEEAYQSALKGVVARLDPRRPVQLISLGSGGGTKEALFFNQWLHPQTEANSTKQTPPQPARYIAIDGSASLAVVSVRNAIQTGVSSSNVNGIVMDLATVPSWEKSLNRFLYDDHQRLVCFFGMLPNFEPGTTWPRLKELLRPGDWLLFSANLSPLEDLKAGTHAVLHLYDNPPTREWLLTFLLDIGVEREKGALTFSVEKCPEGSGLYRIESRFKFTQHCEITVEGVRHVYEPGDSLLMFYSYRHSPAYIGALLQSLDLPLTAQWISSGADEGVFLTQRPHTQRGDGVPPS